MAGSDLNLLEIVGNWLEIGWKWLDMLANGLKLLEMARYG